MDSLTHIYFAQKLLSISGCNISASVCSLFPQIDREPAYYHRMYGHPFFQIRELAEIGTYVYKHDEIRADAGNTYAWNRYKQDRPRMKHFVQRYLDETHIDISDFDPDIESVLIGYVSHTYQDIFNNPMQAFLPHSVYPCGKWNLWAEVHPIHFRTLIYTPETLVAFRSEFFNHNIWSTKLDKFALLKAMVNRTSVASVVQVPPHVVNDAFYSFGLECDVQDVELRTAEEFLIEHEYLLERLIRKYGTGSSLDNAKNYLPEIS